MRSIRRLALTVPEPVTNDVNAFLLGEGRCRSASLGGWRTPPAQVPSDHPVGGPGSRGATMDEYLASAPVVSTGLLDEAREAVSRIYLRHELVGSDNGMAMRLNAVVDRVMTVGSLTYPADTELIMPATEDCYVINLTLVGTTKAARGDGQREVTEAKRRGLVLSPVRNHRVRWAADAEQLHLKIPRSSLESHLSDLLGEPVTEVVAFDYGLDLT